MMQKKYFITQEENNQTISKIELPIIESSMGEFGLEISKLHKEFKCFAYDPAYMATASCKSSITYIDGEKGVLKHRGYDIQSLTDNHSFIETSFLLLYSKLPTDAEQKEFSAELIQAMEAVDVDRIASLLQNFSRDAHPMSMIISVMSLFASDFYDLYKESNKGESELNKFCISAIGAMLTTVAVVNCYINNTNITLVDGKLPVVDNFLTIMFNKKMETSVVEAIDKLLILHLDHEQNASTSAVRSVGSTGVNLFGAICAGVASLWGPLHGGANEEVIRMLESIKEKGIDAQDYIEKVKSKTDNVKLMGFGHRVYKNYDPRAGVIKKYCDQILFSAKYGDVKLLDIAKKLETAALSDEYFIQRKLFPNVDFYSGVIYKAIGIPESMFTPMFASARVVGWVCQWKEMVLGNEKISRPRQIYTGDKEGK